MTYKTWFELLLEYYLAGVSDGGNEDRHTADEIRDWITDDGLDPDADSPVERDPA